MEPVLLITGCIKPDINQRFLLLSDINERYKQYIDSAEYYILNSPFKKIVYCDNSNVQYDINSGLKEKAQKLNKEFQWIQFQGNNKKVVIHGKGYGEGEIIDYALSHCTIIKNCSSFAKVTGRLCIKNIKQIMKQVSAERSYFNLDIYRAKGIDTRFYICQKDFYIKHLRYLYMSATEQEKDNTIEDVFYKALRKIHGWSALPLYPRFSGKSGGNGRNYDNEPELKLKFFDIMCKMKCFNLLYGFYKRTLFRVVYKIKLFLYKNR